MVSLIMCVWRPQQNWLLEAVESVLGQRGCFIELIVVDDGSPEPAANLLTAIKDERLRIVRIEHGGTSRARNAGIAVARGGYLRFIDGDDVLEPGSTARLLHLLGTDDDVIAYGATMHCDANLRPYRKRGSRIDGDATTACLLGQFDVTIPAMLFSRRIVESVGEWNPAISVCEDWDYVLRALEHGRVRGENAVELYYRRHAGSASGDLAAIWQGTLQVVEGYLDRHPEVRGTRLETRIRAMLNIRMAERTTGGRPWSSHRFWQGILADPCAAPRVLGKYLPDELRRLAKRIAQRTLPARFHAWLESRKIGRQHRAPAG